MKIFLFTFLLFVSSQQTLLAAPTQTNPVWVSTYSTGDSHVEMRGTARSDKVYWIQIVLRRANTSPILYYVTPNKDLTWTKHVYLSLGTGTYSFDVFEIMGPSVYVQNPSAFVSSFSIQNLDQTNRLYLLPSSRIESDDPVVAQLAKAITAGVSSPLDKTIAIHDWITNNIAYDTDEYVMFLKGTGYPWPASAIRTLKNKKAICQGYASLFAALQRAAGVPTRIIRGEASGNGQSWGSHEWNEVYIDNRWVTIDTTWDAGGVKGNINEGFIYKKNPTKKYFDPDPEMFEKNHKTTLKLPE